MKFKITLKKENQLKEIRRNNKIKTQKKNKEFALIILSYSIILLC